MKNCPQCGQSRVGEEYKCPKCDVFYSQLDELLYEQQQQLEKNTLKGKLKAILATDHPQQALKNELKAIYKAAPFKTKITLWTIFAFVFALVFGI